MKKELIIKKLSDDNYLDAIVAMHCQIFSGSELYGRLIYFTNNFADYFRQNIFYSKNDYVFGIFNEDIFSGFLHFKQLNRNLFLNHIFLNDEVRGGGTGTTVLKKILNELCIKEQSFEYLELDVLESNIIAKKWYDKLGLSVENRYGWYVVESANKNQAIQDRFKIAYDDNGFKSLLFDGYKVATIIDNSVIIMHADIALEYISSLTFIVKKDGGGFIKKGVTLSEFDASIRMKAKISDILI